MKLLDELDYVMANRGLFSFDPNFITQVSDCSMILSFYLVLSDKSCVKLCGSGNCYGQLLSCLFAH